MKSLNDELNTRAEVICEFRWSFFSNATDYFNALLNDVIAILIVDASQYLRILHFEHNMPFSYIVTLKLADQQYEPLHIDILQSLLDHTAAVHL